MYNYDFGKETIIHESVNHLVAMEEKETRVNIIVTNHYLLIFKNIKEGNVFTSRGIYEMPEYELLLKLELAHLKYEIHDENTVINYNENELIVFNFDLNKVKNI